ncbi:MAG TPA: biotin/lipoyl-binding protein, partial [Tepidisphaeraceae bacterium]
LFYTLPQELKVVGLLMGVGALAMFLLVPTFKLLKYLSTDPELHRKRGRAWAFTGAVTACVVLLVGFVKLPVTVRAEGYLEAASRETVRAKTAGFVADVRVTDGQWVEAGQVILTLSNPAEERILRQQEIELEIAEKAIQESQFSEDGAARYNVDVQKRDLLKKVVADQEKKVNNLLVIAPLTGKIVAPDINNYPGRYFGEAQDLVTITQTSELEAFVIIDQGDRQRLSNSSNYETQVRVAGDLRTTVDIKGPIRIQPAASNEVRNAALTHAAGGERAPDPTDNQGRRTTSNQFEARFLFDNPADYYPGQRAYVRFKTDQPEPLATQAYRWFQQLTMQTTQS